MAGETNEKVLVAIAACEERLLKAQQESEERLMNTQKELHKEVMQKLCLKESLSQSTIAMCPPPPSPIGDLSGLDATCTSYDASYDESILVVIPEEVHSHGNAKRGTLSDGKRSTRRQSPKDRFHSPSKFASPTSSNPFAVNGSINSKMSFSVLSVCSTIFKGSQESNKHHERNIIIALIVGVVACIAWVEFFKCIVLDPRLEPDSTYEAADYLVAPSNDFRWDWTGKGVTGNWSSSTFVTYQVVVAWFTCTFTGLLMEFMMGKRMLSIADSITEHHEAMWKLAQFLFPFIILVGILLVRNGNALGMVFGVVGMWKFGFPETISIMSKAIQSSNRENFSHHTVVSYMKAYGKLIHHSCSMACFCVFGMGASPMTRPFLAMSLPLVVQHLNVPLKYISYGAYSAVAVCVEAWFEMEVFANVEYLYYPHGVSGAQQVYNPVLIRSLIALTTAHWIYFIAGIIEIAGKLCDKHKVKDINGQSVAKKPTVQQWKATMAK